MSGGTHIPSQVGSEPAQIIGVDTRHVVKLAVGAASSNAALPDADSVVVTSDADCYIALGLEGVTADDTKLPLWDRQPIVLRRLSWQSHIAVIGTSGNVWVTPVRVD